MAPPLNKDDSQKPRKPPIARTLMRLTNTLCTISEQRPYDTDAQRRALAGIELCRRRLNFSRQWETFLQEPEIKGRAADSSNASQTQMESRLPTEIYIIIIKHLIDDRYGKSPEQMKVLCEEYLYTHPRSQRLSKNAVSHWLFLFSLTVEPRRARQVRSLSYEPQPHCTYPTAWQSTLKLCTNLSRLGLVYRHHISECVRQHMQMHMGPIFAACPKVTEFKYDIGHVSSYDEPEVTPEQRVEFSQRYSKFAKQLYHLEVLGEFESIKDILHYDYPNLKSLALDMGDYVEEGRFFGELSYHTPALETLVLDWVESATLQDLQWGFKAWGKTLRSLYINHPVLDDDHDHGILGDLLPHLTRLEDLGLGDSPTFLLSDLQAIAQPNAPRLKTFRWVANDEIYTCDPLANPENVSKAIIDIFIAHSETLRTFMIEESFTFWSFGTYIFEHLHKARNLENLRVQLHDIPTKEDIQGLLTACPKLGKSETGLMVVKEFFTECTLTTRKYKEDNFEAAASSWGKYLIAMEARPPKSLRPDRFQRDIQALRIIAQQRPDDPEAQRRAQVATDLYLQTWPHHTLPTPVKKTRGTVSIPRLPNEIYERIFGYILAEHPTSKRGKIKRARTLLSLTCSCRLFQAIVEKYLYKHPRSKGFWRDQHSLFLFRLSLTIEPCRGLLVQSLSVNIQLPYHNYLWVEIAKLCPNLSHLEIVETTDGLSYSQLHYLERLFDACPNVTRLSLNARISDYNDGVTFRTSKRFFKFWNQLTHVEGLPLSEPGDIISISKKCPSLQRLKIDGFGFSPKTLLDASKIWGKTLKTLHLDWFGMPTDTTIAQLLGNLPLIEEVCLGHLDNLLPSVHALTHLSLPKLKRLRVVSYSIWDIDQSPEIESAICDMITAHAETLESMSLPFLYDLDRCVLEAIKKARKLEFLNLEALRLLTDEEREELRAACPKLRTFANSFDGYSSKGMDSEFDRSGPNCGSWGIIPDE
ncbi:hypothetical protein FPANT_1647 [Fusarium pseudoanthophilum]|uniref:F-box domain-containing protein n=1 Tax=Fusarium pseudoanthophilum TaxID=48495 RepID=A0A8H5PSF6_9HYPO|nr:hypothetical protein FPANT_1647 [Fusarium pseudoanthophilum]